MRIKILLHFVLLCFCIPISLPAQVETHNNIPFSCFSLSTLLSVSATELNHFHPSGGDRLWRRDSDELKKLRSWAMHGAIIGFAGGLIVGVIKVMSAPHNNDGLTAAVVGPLAVGFYTVVGMLIGMTGGAIGYFIFEYPWQER